MLSRWKSKDKSEKSGKSSNTSGKKKRKGRDNEEDWQGDPRIDGGFSEGETNRGPARGRPSRREDARRHTLGASHGLYMHHHYPPGHISTIDIERNNNTQMVVNMPVYATVTKYRDMKPNRNFDPRMKEPPMTHYQQTNNALFDDDPGVMSEVETSSTGFRRGGKQRSSLPVVRTPSKTLERPLGLVFLQYRNETKRALLPNEITSIDTVKALFVRSFPKQLTMQYMDSRNVKIYIHDSSKTMFYELEDMRTHLRDIRDRSVLRLFEATDIDGGAFPGAVGVGSMPMPPGAAGCSSSACWDQDQNYFSEPEIDSDYHHHVHNKNKKETKNVSLALRGSDATRKHFSILEMCDCAYGKASALKRKAKSMCSLNQTCACLDGDCAKCCEIGLKLYRHYMVEKDDKGLFIDI